MTSEGVVSSPGLSDMGGFKELFLKILLFVAQLNYSCFLWSFIMLETKTLS